MPSWKSGKDQMSPRSETKRRSPRARGEVRWRNIQRTTRVRSTSRSRGSREGARVSASGRLRSAPAGVDADDDSRDGSGFRQRVRPLAQGTARGDPHNRGDPHYRGSRSRHQPDADAINSAQSVSVSRARGYTRLTRAAPRSRLRRCTRRAQACPSLSAPSYRSPLRRLIRRRL